jgi:hypothetical protein
MSTVKLVDEHNAPPKVRAIFEDIKATPCRSSPTLSHNRTDYPGGQWKGRPPRRCI